MGNLPSRANACGAAFDSADANAARIADDSATSRARKPLRLTTVMSTSSRDKRRRAASSFPALAAQCNGVDPSSSRGSVAAPRENKSRSAPTSPQYAATCVGVSPSAPAASGSDPRSRRYVNVAKSPRSAATCEAARPSTSSSKISRERWKASEEVAREEDEGRVDPEASSRCSSASAETPSRSSRSTPSRSSRSSRRGSSSRSRRWRSKTAATARASPIRAASTIVSRCAYGSEARSAVDDDRRIDAPRSRDERRTGRPKGSALAEPSDADSDAEPVDLDPGDAFGSRAANAGLRRRDKTSCASRVRCSGRVGSSAAGFEPSTSGRAYGWSGRSREGTWNPPSSSRASEGTYMPEIPLRPVYPLA